MTLWPLVMEVDLKFLERDQPMKVGQEYILKRYIQ